MSGPNYFSILRWRSDPTRDEARNVAVVLVDSTGQSGGIRSAPISSVSPRLHDQGIVDALVRSLETRFASPTKPSIEDLNEMRRGLSRSLEVTEPRRVAAGDTDTVLNALFDAYARPRVVQSSARTKGRVLDEVVGLLRRRGVGIRRAHYVNTFLFDVVSDDEELVGEVLSFASGAKNATPAENDAGHFLYGLRRSSLRGVGIVEPPPTSAGPSIVQSHDRVVGWMHDEGVEVVAPSELRDVDRVRELFGPIRAEAAVAR